MLSILVVVTLIVTTFLYLKKGTKTKTTQDIIGGTEVTQSGLIQSGNIFKMAIEVEPANLDTASAAEHKNVWVNFLSMINTVTVPYTFIMHSEIFEMRDYTDDLEKRLKQNDLPPALYKSGQATRDYLMQSTEAINAKIQDFRGYMILQYDPILASQGVAFETGLQQVDNLLGKTGTKNSKMTDMEKSDLAEQMLMDVAEVVFRFCEQIGMRYQLLNRVGVLNVSYQLLQREIAPYARMVDAMERNAFHPIKRSITAENV